MSGLADTYKNYEIYTDKTLSNILVDVFCFLNWQSLVEKEHHSALVEQSVISW